MDDQSPQNPASNSVTNTAATTAASARESRPQQPRLSWEQIKTFEEDNVVITVSRLPLRRAQYAYDIRARAMDGRAVPFFKVTTEGKGKIEVTPACVTEVLVRLKHEAEEYIRTCAQHDEDVFRDRQLAYERAQVARDKPKPTVGLKALAQRDKEARDNLERITRPSPSPAPAPASASTADVAKPADES